MICLENLHSLMIDKMHNNEAVLCVVYSCICNKLMLRLNGMKTWSLNIIMLLMIFELDQCSEMHFVDHVSRVQMQSNKPDSNQTLVWFISGPMYRLEKQTEPNLPVDLDSTLESQGTMEFCLVRENSGFWRHFWCSCYYSTWSFNVSAFVEEFFLLFRLN